MKISFFLPVLLLSCLYVEAQETRPITLKQAIEGGLQHSKSIQAAAAATQTSTQRVKSAKNAQYPSVNISTEYLHLFTNTNIDLKIPLPNSESSGGTDKVSPSHLLIGQANASLPLFHGFKIRNAIKQSEYAVELSKISETASKEDAVWQTINLYFGLYKTQQSIAVLNENLSRAKQRVRDFQNFLDNGIIARNDLLRAKLQTSNVELSLEETKTTYKNLNYRLNLLIGLPENTVIAVEQAKELPLLPVSNAEFNNRKDIQILEERSKMTKNGIRLARAGYYPSLGISAGYMALDLDQVAKVTNATNVGVALKYDLTSIFKNRAEVKIAKSQDLENDFQIELLADKAKVETQEAYNKYVLALKKNEVITDALEQANENFRIVKDKYDNGLADTDDLLEADIQQLQAQINQVLGEVDEQLSIYEYAFTTGNLLENVQ